ncbi:zinc finger protein 571-like isoform X4 [Cydia pomonella]|uniref:zinc finger protein 571-like isoform X4 n=1 Tax=Cydia pomonella TaxID=82600 RepID=UPI002ADE84CA|nr:zinc finger protein 571-like isoform X4 [Cydia pomonella]
MEASADSGRMSPARVKEEAERDLAEMPPVKEEAEFMDEEERVKEECSDSDDGCGVSEAAMLAGLYAEHEVKDELVLGPERPHRPTVGLVVRGGRALDVAEGGRAAAGARGAGARLARDCSVRLERLASRAARAPQPAAAADSDSEHQSYGTPEKEETCDICGESFDLKSDLIKHVAVHIHVPASAEQGAGRPDVTGNARVKEEAEFMDEEERVIEECSDSDDGCGVSEAAMLAGLYAEHEVKDELVLGPERPHRPTVGLVVRGNLSGGRALDVAEGGRAAAGARGAGARLARDCSVRLERLASRAARAPQPAAAADSDGEHQSYGTPEKEETCDICGESFDLKSDLIKHVAVHIHVPASAEQGAGRPDVTGNGEL